MKLSARNQIAGTIVAIFRGAANGTVKVIVKSSDVLIGK